MSIFQIVWKTISNSCNNLTNTKISFDIQSIEETGFHLFITGNYGNSPLNFLLDSGAALSMCDPQMVDGLPLSSTQKMHAQGVGEVLTTLLLEVNQFDVNGATLTDYTALSIDLDAMNTLFSSMGQREIDGIFGADLLVNLGAKIDFIEHVLIINGTSVPLTVVNYGNGASHLFAEIEINHQLLWFNVDTGASHTVFSQQVVNAVFNVPLELWTPNNDENIGLGHQPAQTLMSLAGITFSLDFTCDIKMLQLDLAHINQKYVRLGLPEIHAILGCDWFVQHVSLLDFETSSLVLS